MSRVYYGGIFDERLLWYQNCNMILSALIWLKVISNLDIVISIKLQFTAFGSLRFDYIQDLKKCSVVDVRIVHFPLIAVESVLSVT